VIRRALGLGHGQVVAVVGAGGKTTLVYRLAAEAHEAGLSVLVTTTTHMGTLPDAVTGPVFIEVEAETEGEVTEALRDALLRERRATLLGRRIREDKLEGVSPERVDALRGVADLLLVEADGARGRSLKVPAPHSTTTTCIVSSWSAPPPGRRWASRWTPSAWPPRCGTLPATCRASRTVRAPSCS
jgi:probable selenium-dependent hydroxylase accessory protein YqeC